MSVTHACLSVNFSFIERNPDLSAVEISVNKLPTSVIFLTAFVILLLAVKNVLNLTSLDDCSPFGMISDLK